MDAIWIERHKEAEAESNGYVVVEPESVLATHLSQIMYKFAHEVLGRMMCNNYLIISRKLRQTWSSQLCQNWYLCIH